MAHRRVALLNVRAIEAARAGDTLTEAATRGLRLAIGRSGTRSWVYRYRLRDGALRQVTLGAYPAMSIQGAREAWGALRDARKAGADPREVAAAQKPAPSVSVADLVRTYLTEHIDRARKPKGRAETHRLMNLYVLGEGGIGERNAAEFDVPSAAAFLLSVRAKSLASARVLRAELRAAWRQALEAGRVKGGNPFADILKGRLPQLKRSRYLDDAELRALFAWLPEAPISQDIRDALELTLRLAMRSGEVVALPWSAIDLRAGQITLRATKTDAPRTIRAPKQAMEILERRRAAVPVGEAWVFPSPLEGQHIAQKAIVLALCSSRAECPLEHFTAHDLRRSARTHLSRLGVSHEVGEAALGHTKGGVAGIYDLHRYEREVGEALQRLSDHLDALRDAQGQNVVAIRR